MNWIIPRKANLAKGTDAAERAGLILPLAYPGDSSAHDWQVTVTNNGEPVDLTGASVVGYFYRHHDGETPFVTGMTSGNVASVLIPAEAYAYTDRVTAIMRATIDGSIVTLDAIEFTVAPNLTGELIDPGDVINIDTVLAEIETMEALIPQAQGVISSSVRYDTTQSLTSAQKQRARSNIDAISADEAGAYVSVTGTTLTITNGGGT